MLGVAHVRDVNPLHLAQACGQGYLIIKVALMDDGSVECYDYYRHMGRGICRDCPIKAEPKGILLGSKTEKRGEA